MSKKWVMIAAVAAVLYVWMQRRAAAERQQQYPARAGGA